MIFIEQQKMFEGMDKLSTEVELAIYLLALNSIVNILNTVLLILIMRG